MQECGALAWLDIINPGRLDDFLKNFSLTIPIHNFSSTGNQEVLLVLPLIIHLIIISIKIIFSLQFHGRALNEIYNHYFANNTSQWDRNIEYVNLISDMNMVYPIDKAAKMQSAFSNTFYYE